MTEEDPALRRIGDLSRAVADEFATTQRLLTFEEWFAMLCEKPQLHARSAAQFVRDALAHFGRRDVRTPSGHVERFQLFDRPFDRGHRLVGQELAQTHLFELIDGFCRLGRVNSLILLHGPNGSAKSTLLECLQRGLEAYSHTDEGVLYRFGWVFPTKRVESGGIGFDASPIRDALGEESFARLQEDAVASRVEDEVKDHPVFLIPPEHRRELLADICARFPDFVAADVILEGDLSARNRRIFDALLNAHQGNVAEVYKHVQVERLFLSRD